MRYRRPYALVKLSSSYALSGWLHRNEDRSNNQGCVTNLTYISWWCSDSCPRIRGTSSCFTMALFLFFSFLVETDPVYVKHEHLSPGRSFNSYFDPRSSFMFFLSCVSSVDSCSYIKFRFPFFFLSFLGVAKVVRGSIKLEKKDRNRGINENYTHNLLISYRVLYH